MAHENVVELRGVAEILSQQMRAGMTKEECLGGLFESWSDRLAGDPGKPRP